MANNQEGRIDINRLQAVIEKFQYAVTDAQKNIDTSINKKAPYNRVPFYQ